MASRESKPVKQLKDLLQEQQEPFILEIYLLEKGCLKKGLNSQVSFNCCHGNSTKCLKELVSCDQKKKQKSDLHCSKVLKAVHKQVVSINERLKTRSSNARDGNSGVSEESKNKKEVAELDRFSSASSTTVFNSCSDSEETSATKNVNNSRSFRLGNKIEKELLTKQAATDRRNLQSQFLEGCIQHSPVSVLEDTGIHGVTDEAEEINAMKGITPNRFKFSTKVTEDSILSASLWEILVHSGTQKENKKLEVHNTFSQYSKSKTVLHETRQLLFDCITEVLETRERKKQQRNGCKYLETEGLGKLIGDEVKKWGKHCGKESNLPKLLELDFVDSAQEWSVHTQQLSGIVKEIQESILEDMTIEIVMGMIASGRSQL